MWWDGHIYRVRAALLVGTVALIATVGSATALAQQSVSESTTEFSFSMSNVTVPAGQPVTFALQNAGNFPHSMVVEDTAGVTVNSPAPNSIQPGGSGALVVTFSRPGTYDFWCPVGNHRERGMVGTITVAAAQSAGAAGRAGGLDPSMAAAGLAVLAGASFGIGALRRRRA